jgi:threonine aldolase
MLRAMAEAPLGDDVYAEDPTVNRLQEMLAELTGFDAALFMPSGTMTNQVALAVHAERGTEVILPEGGHVYEYEPGSMAVISGLLPRVVRAPRGVPAAADVQAAVHRSIHQAPSGVIVLENTHNRAGGTVVPLERCREIRAVADAEGLPLHLDGARAFNAATALDVEISEVCAAFHSASICLSKGLAAPVGSVLLGSSRFIGAAHRYRKLLGGGMRQAGVLAAAGIVAVTEMTGRLAEDHARARTLAAGLAQLGGFSVDLESVQTNMVYLQVQDAAGICARLAERGVLCNALDASTIRLVTHYHVTDEDITWTIEQFGLVGATVQRA